MVRVVGKKGALGAGVCVGIAAAAWMVLEDNEVISSAWKCLLLERISKSGGAFEQERAGGIQWRWGVKGFSKGLGPI